MVYLKCSLVKEDKTMQNDVVIHGCLLYVVFQTSKIIFLMRSDKCLCYNKEGNLYFIINCITKSEDLMRTLA